MLRGRLVISLRAMWPDGMRCAAAFTFDFDAEEAWLGEIGERRSTGGAVAGHLRREVAVPLVLELLAQHGVRATFFVPGRVAERYPGRIDEIVAAGHELAHPATRTRRQRRSRPTRNGPSS